MIVYTKTKIKRLLMIDFVRFCIVGGSGFVINLIILTMLANRLKVPVEVAQFVGAEIALFSNFVLHNKWTYKANKVDKTNTKLVLQFHLTSWPAILGSTAMVSISVRSLNLSEIEALVISSIVALAWNFVWSKYVIWKDVSLAEAKNLDINN